MFGVAVVGYIIRYGDRSFWGGEIAIISSPTPFPLDYFGLTLDIATIALRTPLYDLLLLLRNAFVAWLNNQ